MNRPSPDDMNDIIMAEQRAKIKELEEENEELKNNLEEIAKELIQHHEEYKNMADMVVELQEENKKLKEELQIYKKQYQHSMWDDE